MKQIKAGTILENAARLAGRDATRLGVPVNWTVLATMSINSGMTRLAAEKFPFMTRIEFRRYRPSWKSGISYAVGNEVFLDDAYWRKESAGSNDPKAGGNWRKLKQEEVAAFVAWSQPWENTVIHRAGVDATRFAYAADPKYNPNAAPLRAAKVTAFGIELQAPAPLGVYCQFVPEYPHITFDEWNEGIKYVAGEVAYRKATKDVYECLTNDAPIGEAPEDSEHWIPVRIPGEFETYLTRLVSVDFLTLDQGKQQSQAHAEAEFERICEMYHEGNGETTVRRGRFF